MTMTMTITMTMTMTMTMMWKMSVPILWRRHVQCSDGRQSHYFFIASSPHSKKSPRHTSNVFLTRSKNILVRTSENASSDEKSGEKLKVFVSAQTTDKKLTFQVTNNSPIIKFQWNKNQDIWLVHLVRGPTAECGGYPFKFWLQTSCGQHYVKGDTQKGLL